MLPSGLTTFVVSRGNDASGVSGVGLVIEGVIFNGGATVIHWLTPYQSVTFFEDFETFIHIHIFSHPLNDTQITFHFPGGEIFNWRQDEAAS